MTVRHTIHVRVSCEGLVVYTEVRIRVSCYDRLDYSNFDCNIYDVHTGGRARARSFSSTASPLLRTLFFQVESVACMHTDAATVANTSYTL